jgi:hypothetical protein
VAPICRWQAKTALPESGVVAGHSVLFDRDIWAAGSRGREYPQPTDAVVSHRNRNTWKETLPPMGDMCLEAFTAE